MTSYGQLIGTVQGGLGSTASTKNTPDMAQRIAMNQYYLAMWRSHDGKTIKEAGKHLKMIPKLAKRQCPSCGAHFARCNGGQGPDAKKNPSLHPWFYEEPESEDEEE